MCTKLLRRTKSNKGFTLIELIVVIAILAILALILVPRFSGFTESAANRTNAGNRRTVESAVQVMISDGRLTGAGEFTVEENTDVTVSAGGTLKWNGATAAAADIKGGLVALIGDNLKPAGTVTHYLVKVTADGVDVEDVS